MEPKLFFLAMYSTNFTNTTRWTIIIATTITKISPHQTMTTLHKASHPFCRDLEKENLCKLQCKLCSVYIRIKQAIVFKLEFFNYNLVCNLDKLVNFIHCHSNLILNSPTDLIASLMN